MTENKQNNSDITFLKTLYVFLKIGIMTFGGAATALPNFKRELVERGWITEDELYDYVAYSQCTPGVIMINIATFFGANHFGVLGGFLVALVSVLPSVLCILVLSLFLTKINKFSDDLNHIYEGMRIAICAVGIRAIYSLTKKSITNVLTLVFAVLAFVALFLLNLSPLIVIIATFLLGLLVYVLKILSKAGITK